MATLSFPRTHRLTHERQFDAVYAARMRRSRGPVTVHSRPNRLPHYRLGLSIGKPLGGATVRNRFKRLVREAFRLNHPALPRLDSGGLDIIVSLRRHDELSLDAYGQTLLSLAGELVAEWARRQERGDPP